MMAEGRFSYSDYTLVWICALPLELAAASAMLEETHPPLQTSFPPQCSYKLGKVNGHNIVLACLPSGVYGTTSAAVVVSHLKSTFPNIRCGLLVGIGGGVPSEAADIRLGDVVVSRPTGGSSGVVQYDFGKSVSGGRFQPTGTMNQPPTLLLTAVSQLEANEMKGGCERVSQIMLNALNQHPEMENRFSKPPAEEDYLYHPTYDHPDSSVSCNNCDTKMQVTRVSQTLEEPQIHYGTIASGNRVIKDGRYRDQIAQELNALCFEMEAAGIMNHLPCLVIRGICDYCDSHKNKRWQGYAALAAAAYAKLLLSVIPVNEALDSQHLRKACWIVPFEQNSRFIGRESEIHQLENQIFAKAKSSSQKAAIAGLGGVGKTQIALELAYRIREQDPRYSIFWIQSTSVEAIEQSFMTISMALRLQVAASDVKSQVRAALSLASAGPWLLIIDNADDMDMWTRAQNSSPALKTFLPRCQSGFILFTTRNRQLANRLVGPNIISVSELDDTLARDLLRDSLVQGDRDLMYDQQSAMMLIHHLGNLPLALIQAASYINQNMISLKEYLSILDEQENTIIELLSEDFDDDYRYTEIKNPVAVTWMISFQQIQKSNSLATEYLSRIACINPRDIPLSLLPPGASRIEQQKAIGILESYSFITRLAEYQMINMHRLVHLATRNWLRSEKTLTDWTLQTGERLCTIFPSDENENRMLWREYLPHALFVLDSRAFPMEGETREELSKRVGRCLYADGRYNEAQFLFQEVFKAQSSRLEKEDPEVLLSMAWVGSTYCNQGRWKDAEELEVQVMETSKRVLGDEHPDTLTSMANLASTYQNQGRWNEAEELNIQVIETSKRVLGDEHPDTLTSIGNLASTYQNQGRWKDAEELKVQVMEIRKRVLGDEHPDTLTSIGNLALTYQNQGQWKDAEELEVQVMETRKRVLGDEHPHTLTSMANLALTYHSQRQWKDAEELEVQVMETSKRVLGDEHPDTLISMANLASTYRNQGRWKDAEELEVQVMETRKRVLGDEHPSTLKSMWNLSHTWKSQGRHREAIALLESCVKLQHKRLGPTHPDTTNAMSDLESWRGILLPETISSSPQFGLSTNTTTSTTGPDGNESL